MERYELIVIPESDAHSSGKCYSLFQEVLLGPDHGARAADAYPGDGFRGSEAVVFHQVTANQSARTTQARYGNTRPTMNLELHRPIPRVKLQSNNKLHLGLELG